MDLETLRFPIGQFQPPAEITQNHIKKAIFDFKSFPERLQKEVENLTQEQLNTQYRPEGWTIRQVVHHCADSHMNSIIRFKWALTENHPTIKPYFEQHWAELHDTVSMPIEASIMILKGVHQRWVVLIESLSDEDLNRTFVHPEHNKVFNLRTTILLYAWHGNHHLAHITELKKRNAW